MENTIQTRFYNQLAEKYLQILTMNPQETKKNAALKLGISQQFLNKVLRETGNNILVRHRTVHRIYDDKGSPVFTPEAKKFWKEYHNKQKLENEAAEEIMQEETLKKKKRGKITAGAKEEMLRIANFLNEQQNLAD